MIEKLLGTREKMCFHMLELLKCPSAPPSFEAPTDSYFGDP